MQPGGEWDGFSGFNWGGGGAATAAAYLELKFGGALVNVANTSKTGSTGARRALGVGIDGVRVDNATLKGSTLMVKVTNALEKYGTATGGAQTACHCAV